MSKYFAFLTLLCFSLTTCTGERPTWLAKLNAGLNRVIYERGCSNRRFRYPCPLTLFSLSAAAGVTTMVIGMTRHNGITTFTGLGSFVASLIGIICVMQKEEKADQQAGEGQFLTRWSATVNPEERSRNSQAISETTSVVEKD